MLINELNEILGKVKAKLESLDPARLMEQSKASEQNPARIAGAKKRLEILYKRLTADRPDCTKVVATGSKRT